MQVAAYCSPEGEVRLYDIDHLIVVMMSYNGEWKGLECLGMEHGLEMFDWCVYAIHTNIREYC